MWFQFFYQSTLSIACLRKWTDEGKISWQILQVMSIKFISEFTCVALSCIILVDLSGNLSPQYAHVNFFFSGSTDFCDLMTPKGVWPLWKKARLLDFYFKEGKIWFEVSIPCKFNSKGPHASAHEFRQIKKGFKGSKLIPDSNFIQPLGSYTFLYFQNVIMS